jgi:hypothetical protein
MQTRTTQIIVLIAALLLGINNPSKAQTTSWNWLTQTESTNSEISQGFGIDAQGNVYHAGLFADSVLIDGNMAYSWGGPLAASGYLSKYAPGGLTNNWNLVIGSRGNNSPFNHIRGLSVDDSGNSYFWYDELNTTFPIDTIQIGPNHQWIKTLGAKVSILIKVNSQGNVDWFKAFDLLNSAGPIYSKINSQGDIYLAGHYSGGSLTLDTINLPPGSKFLAKINTNGNFIWARSYTNAGGSLDLELELNQQDEIFISGAWEGDTLTLDGLSVINPTPSFKKDRYIAKFNSAGQVLCLVNEGGQGDEKHPASLVTKASGGVMCLSITDNSEDLILNEGALSLSTSGVILSQYDAQGNFESYKNYSINTEFRGFSLLTSSCILAGDGADFFMSVKYTNPQLNLDGQTIINAGGNSGSSDIMLAKIDTMGSILWLTNIGSVQDEEVFELDYSASNGLTISGYSESSQLAFGNDTLVNNGFLTSEAFVANLSYSGIGLNELKKVETISLYPNPTSGQLFFNLEETESERITLKVGNLIGQVVLEKTIDNKSAKHFIDVQNLSPGLYLLNLKDGNKTYSGKFIKK